MQAYRRRGEFRAYSKYDLTEMLQGEFGRVADKIREEKAEYLLNVNRDQYLTHLEGVFRVTGLEFQQEQLAAESDEMLVPAEMHSNNFFVREGHAYPRLVITYRLPFTGRPDRLQMRANVSGSWTPLIWVEGNFACFDFIDFGEGPAKIRQEAEGVVKNLVQGAVWINDQVRGFNARLRESAGAAFDARKKQLLERQNFLAELKVPIRNTGATAQTYATPTPKRVAPPALRPAVADRAFVPDPTMEASTYHDILKVIHDLGTAFERHPATYVDLDEETLRDHLLIALAPNFKGTTGETFNKAGKTDILWRYQDSNLFVAECKFWTGPKGCLDTLSQLLRYLTWRDSKAAAIFFVQNKDFSAVLAGIRETVAKHPNYLREVAASSETWLNFRFHINDDRNREVWLSVLLFHFPA